MGGRHESQLPRETPTPEQIEERAAAIRAEWNEHEWARARRRYGASMPGPQGRYRFSNEVNEDG